MFQRCISSWCCQNCITNPHQYTCARCGGLDQAQLDLVLQHHAYISNIHVVVVVVKARRA